ncbi:hypothetical protein [Psychrobacillus antarcticus]|uniref:hypothetical protein n=1 Tax=Psychrobacillus antarcticus TaxID=2879115 RepID=UPI002407CD9E|nr:hypothetical protein [Psychrobacillus antarcticus]
MEDKEGSYAKRISDNVEMTIGASWELNTMDKNEYDISLVEGHTINKNTLALTSAIKEVETLKD